MCDELAHSCVHHSQMPLAVSRYRGSSFFFPPAVVTCLIALSSKNTAPLPKRRGPRPTQLGLISSIFLSSWGDIHASSILTLIHTCCAASPLRLQLPIPMLLLKSLYHPIVIVSSDHVQSKSLKSIFQESQLLEHCLEMMPFLFDTLAKGTNYVNEFRKLAGKLSCQ